MTRGNHNDSLPYWAQRLAEINGVTFDDEYDFNLEGSRYAFTYEKTDFLLEERGKGDEIAVMLSGDAEKMSELAETAGYRLETDRKREALLE